MEQKAEWNFFKKKTTNIPSINEWQWLKSFDTVNTIDMNQY